MSEKIDPIIGYRANYVAAAAVAGDTETAKLSEEEKQLAVEKVTFLTLNPESTL